MMRRKSYLSFSLPASMTMLISAITLPHSLCIHNVVPAQLKKYALWRYVVRIYWIFPHLRHHARRLCSWHGWCERSSCNQQWWMPYLRVGLWRGRLVGVCCKQKVSFSSLQGNGWREFMSYHLARCLLRIPLYSPHCHHTSTTITTF